MEKRYIGLGGQTENVNNGFTREARAELDEIFGDGVGFEHSDLCSVPQKRVTIEIQELGHKMP